MNVPFVRALAAGAVVVSLFASGAVAQAAGPRDRQVYECAGPSIDRYQQWLASGEGTTVPATGSLLVREGRGYAAKVAFLREEWHVVVVWLGNQFEARADLSASSGFWLTYSATDDLYLQLRPASHWSGGDKWLTKVPATGGKRVTAFFSFAADSWTWLPELGQPSYSFASALAEARGFVFVGKTANKLDFRGLRIDGYQPPCR
ncbi:hypothetical protein [Actinokineospora diospyrosa]|uniref:Regulation of enolase protein 1 (Concanavalin A-like superfamily) n=1 Tax=Actinokineospora diospyrosa TaxID=103728 RepID=A0ABT1IMJ2_9PSEU|nr:hypothetical protein [Actinokineospora diospyrosa]MCP2273895.1 hypothetical protein [Actinokineospora diospyrosa]